VTAIWFFYDEPAGLLKLWLLDSRQKARNLRANPNVTLYVMGPKNAFRTIEIRCRAEVVEGPGTHRHERDRGQVRRYRLQHLRPARRHPFRDLPASDPGRRPGPAPDRWDSVVPK